MQVKTIHCIQAPTRSGTPVTLAGGLTSQRCATHGCLLTIHFFAIFSFNLRRQNLLRILNILHDTCKTIYSNLEGQVVKWCSGGHADQWPSILFAGFFFNILRQNLCFLKQIYSSLARHVVKWYTGGQHMVGCWPSVDERHRNSIFRTSSFLVRRDFV